jgi:glycosyltransferase involved in cell wall biosynthesis
MDHFLNKIESLVDKVEDESRLSPEPMVSVFMTTYNHENYISQALDGVLMQQVDFPYEIVVGEDKSTDRTREIVCKYQRRHPDKIRLRLSRENLYSQKLKPGWGVLRACRGKYIALCEGDDYWTDPLKLQKQVDLLEAEPEISACYTNAAIVNENGSAQPSVYMGAGSPGSLMVQHKKTCRAQADILSCLGIPTCTVCCRAQYVRTMPEWTCHVPTGDWALAMVLAEHGPIKYMDEITATYRRHRGGVWSSLEAEQSWKQLLSRLEIYRGHAAPDMQPFIADAIQSQKRAMCRHFTGLLVAKLEKNKRVDADFDEKELAGLLGKKECRRIRMDAWEVLFQRAYFKKAKSLARKRVIGLIARCPEWLARKGSVGQALRALTGRI